MLVTSNYWSDCLYPIFLSTINSCTYATFSNQDLADEIDNFALRAIAKFKFPKVSLSFEYDDTIANPGDAPADQRTKGYYFLEEISYKEANVIVAWMKVYWVEYQLSKEKNYENLYADKNVTAFSSGNLISSIEKAYQALWTYARKEEEDYYRVNSSGRPAIGDINVDV